VTAGVVGAEFTNAGHAIAVILGVLVATRFRHPIHWTRVRCLMLAMSSGFGFLLLAHSWWAMVAGLAIGVLGAALAQGLAHRLTWRDEMAGPPLSEHAIPQAVLSA